ncbi:hypothetical protein EIP91_001236 [Steccherinum ochraceum]|uniref:LIM zinc-binding domain-containing protein n=1 Tax=Steccherinum ochraceum TaxID=92696 RepID=A0A4R0RRU4_9APHY|nr:hypothetical protein EIP91_001236 [Steccherinum ochraceum]
MAREIGPTQDLAGPTAPSIRDERESPTDVPSILEICCEQNADGEQILVTGRLNFDWKVAIYDGIWVNRSRLRVRIPLNYDPAVIPQPMAYNQYPSYHSQQHSYPSYNTPPSQPNNGQISRNLPQWPPAQPQQQQQHPQYAPPSSPTRSIAPAQYTPSQQYASLPSHSPVPLAAAPPAAVASSSSRSDYGPFASPVSPTKSQFPRRPLPNPTAGAGKRPATASGSNASPGPSTLPPATVPQQIPRHRPASSLSMQSSSQASSSALARHNTMAEYSARPSVSPPRPLPNPGARSTGSVDLPLATSPNKISLPPLQTSQVGGPEKSGQKFVPHWKRALPTPVSSTASPSSSVAERRGVVSPTPLREPVNKPVVRPLPTSPGGSVRLERAESSSSSESSSPASRSDVSSPRKSATPSPTGSLFSRARDRARNIPGPSPAPTGALPSRPISMIKKPEEPAQASSSVSSSDDDDISNNPLLSRRAVRTPSPTYGIRDLPSRRQQPAAGSQVSPTRAPATPSTSTSLPPQASVSSQQSSIFRAASVQSGHTLLSGGSSSPPKSPRVLPTPSQAGSSKWPGDLPRLPNPPASPAFAQSQRSPSPTRTSIVGQSSLPARNQSLRNPIVATARPSRIRPPSLDDTPPRSLRRTPSPSRATPIHSPTPISPSKKSGSASRPNISTDFKSIVSPIGSAASGRDTPTSVFSLSQFPRPPSDLPPFSPTHGIFPPSSPRAFNGVVPQQQKQQQQPSPVSTQSRPAIPKISFPANAESDSEDEQGPVIVVGGPGASAVAPSPPKISVSGMDDGPSVPSISIGGMDDAPTISVSGASASRKQVLQQLPPLPAVKGKGGLVCGGCGGPIIGRIVSAMGARWHPGCFRCSICNELLENLSSYEHEGRPFCHFDYHEHFAPRCYHCQTAIVDELFITLDDAELGKRTYHEQHFFCAECGDPFLPPGAASRGNKSFSGDGVFKADEDDVGFTVYRGHPYCEPCHVRLRMPKCKKCKKSIRDGMQAVEALGGKWCWECFTCASCERPFDDPSFFLRDDKPFCEPCFSIMIKSEM